MTGSINGVVKQIQDIEKRAIFIHCFGHLLNLAAKDFISQSKILKQALDNTFEIIKLIVKSPRRQAILEKLKDEIGDKSCNVTPLCPTRWTVKANALKSILDNYSLLIQAFEANVDESSSMPLEIKSRILGIVTAMKKFESYLGINLAYFILRQTDNLAAICNIEFL